LILIHGKTADFNQGAWAAAKLFEMILMIMKKGVYICLFTTFDHHSWMVKLSIQNRLTL